MTPVCPGFKNALLVNSYTIKASLVFDHWFMDCFQKYHRRQQLEIHFGVINFFFIFCPLWCSALHKTQKLEVLLLIALSCISFYVLQEFMLALRAISFKTLEFQSNFVELYWILHTV